jgi:hypothetical protein
VFWRLPYYITRNRQGYFIKEKKFLSFLGAAGGGGIAALEGGGIPCQSSLPGSPKQGSIRAHRQKNSGRGAKNWENQQVFGAKGLCFS